ncbi:hypothetical protein [Allokutzneria sp. NRRL B-24872]|uniref:hypothetical protein n=1 Tax=Allokutzneria sp. NRRL B-24872 TaxID=1137961 RepID=UPI0011777A13|nr:hypothetical protein [Allokutzneria sp. NRRL B-24872]
MREVIGIILIVQGIGSLVITKAFNGQEWFLMRWATPYSPWAHIAVAAVGLFLASAGAAARRRKPA